jgi:hypothetical protein
MLDQSQDLGQIAEKSEAYLREVDFSNEQKQVIQNLKEFIDGKTK